MSRNSGQNRGRTGNLLPLQGDVSTLNGKTAWDVSHGGHHGQGAQCGHDDFLYCDPAAMKNRQAHTGEASVSGRWLLLNYAELGDETAHLVPAAAGRRCAWYMRAIRRHPTTVERAHHIGPCSGFPRRA